MSPPREMIYLDNNATTRPAPEVLRACAEAMESLWANPSSLHRPGQAARAAVELARREVAGLIGAGAGEIVFTGSGTESVHTAIGGVVGRSGDRAVIVTTAAEHPAVRLLLEHLERAGRAEVRVVPVDGAGLVDVSAVDRALPGASLATVHWANNETGAIQPVAAIAQRCRAHGVPLHCDATQAVGRVRVDVGEVGVDYLSFSPHKFHGPKGVGVLFIRRGRALAPVLHGSQEQGRRGGTEDVAGIVGAGVACRLAREWLADAGALRAARALRDRLEGAILRRVPGCAVNGPTDPALRLWNTSSVRLPGAEGEAMVVALSEAGVAVSAGSACASGAVEPSRTLLAMGLSEEEALSSVRLSISRYTTAEEVDRAIETVVRVWEAVSSGG